MFCTKYSFSFLRTKSGNKEEHSSASTSREKESGIHTPVSSGQSSSGRQSVSVKSNCKRNERERLPCSSVYLRAGNKQSSRLKQMTIQMTRMMGTPGRSCQRRVIRSHICRKRQKKTGKRNGKGVGGPGLVIENGDRGTDLMIGRVRDMESRGADHGADRRNPVVFGDNRTARQ